MNKLSLKILLRNYHSTFSWTKRKEHSGDPHHAPARVFLFDTYVTPRAKAARNSFPFCAC